MWPGGTSGADGYEGGSPRHRGIGVPDPLPRGDRSGLSVSTLSAPSGYATVNGHKVSVVSGGHSFCRQPSARWRCAARREPIDTPIDADKGRAVVGPGKGGSVPGRTGGAGPVLPGQATAGALSRRLSAAGRMPERGSTARRARNGRAPRQADGAQIHCDADNHAGIRTGCLRRRSGAFGVATSFYSKWAGSLEAGHLWHQRLCLPIRPCRRGQAAHEKRNPRLAAL